MTEAKEKALKDRRFECVNCGICCSHKGLIQPSESNMRELSRFLRLSEWSFAIRFLQEVYDGRLDAYIIAFKTNNAADQRNGCVFHFSRFCAIYGSCRTDLCNVFPWNHYDADAESWNEDFINDEGKSWCRGVGQGPQWAMEEVRQLKQTFTNLGFGFRRHLDQQ